MIFKRKTLIILTLLAGLSIITADAQKRVVLQSMGEMTTFSTANSFIDAYNAAVDGDTIYLPGLEYAPPSPFNKRLVVFGTGHHPTFTGATGRTSLTGLSFGSGAAGSHIEGILVKGNVVFANDTKIDNVTLKRLHITGYISIAGTNPDNNSDNLSIIECISGDFNAQNTKNLKIFNCFIQGRIINLANNGWVSNSVSIYGGHNFSNVHQSQIENNIIVSTLGGTAWGVTASTGNNFSSNIFSADPTGLENNTWDNNHVNIKPQDLFVSYLSPFSYDADYNLVIPLAYQGTTGNQIGLFGGLNPFKPNALPVVPHIIEHTIAASVNELGEIEVSVSVEAQQK
jgi:hypothetical protein